MTEPRKPEQGGGDEVVEQAPAKETEPRTQSKTLQELERLQFAELERER